MLGSTAERRTNESNQDRRNTDRTTAHVKHGEDVEEPVKVRLRPVSSSVVKGPQAIIVLVHVCSPHPPRPRPQAWADQAYRISLR